MLNDVPREGVSFRPFELETKLRKKDGIWNLSSFFDKNYCTNLALVTINHHAHSLHIDALTRYPAKTALQFLAKCIQVRCWNRTNEDWQVAESRSGVLLESDVCAIR